MKSFESEFKGTEGNWQIQRGDSNYLVISGDTNAKICDISFSDYPVGDSIDLEKVDADIKALASAKQMLQLIWETYDGLADKMTKVPLNSREQILFDNCEKILMQNGLAPFVYSFDEAIEMMKYGHKLTHDYFSANEFVTIKNNKMIFEDGVTCTVEEFRSARNFKEIPRWETDWTIFTNK